MKITAAITMALAATVAAQDFAFHCDHGSLRFTEGHFLQVKCNKEHGGKKTTRLDLDKCFTNDNGALRRKNK